MIVDVVHEFIFLGVEGFKRTFQWDLMCAIFIFVPLTLREVHWIKRLHAHSTSAPPVRRRHTNLRKPLYRNKILPPINLLYIVVLLAIRYFKNCLVIATLGYLNFVVYAMSSKKKGGNPSPSGKGKPGN